MSKMKDWPKDGSCAKFTDITGPIVAALQFSHYVERTNQDRDIPWNGFPLGKHEQATCLPPDEALTEKQLGIEQGRRIDRECRENSMSIIEMGSEMVQRGLEQIHLANAPIEEVMEKIKEIQEELQNEPN